MKEEEDVRYDEKNDNGKDEGPVMKIWLYFRFMFQDHIFSAAHLSIHVERMSVMDGDDYSR